MDNFLWGVAAGVLGVAALAFFAFTMFRRGPLTFQIDGHLHGHLACGLEDQSEVDHVALLQRFGQAHEHHVMPAAFHDDLAIGRQIEAFLDMDHPHHAIRIFAMCVQLDPCCDV